MATSVAGVLCPVLTFSITAWSYMAAIHLLKNFSRTEENQSICNLWHFGKLKPQRHRINDGSVLGNGRSDRTFSLRRSGPLCGPLLLETFNELGPWTTMPVRRELVNHLSTCCTCCQSQDRPTACLQA